MPVKSHSEVEWSDLCVLTGLTVRFKVIVELNKHKDREGKHLKKRIKKNPHERSSLACMKQSFVLPFSNFE